MKDEIKKDKDFIHRVEERIYQDDWEKSISRARMDRVDDIFGQQIHSEI